MMKFLAKTLELSILCKIKSQVISSMGSGRSIKTNDHLLIESFLINFIYCLQEVFTFWKKIIFYSSLCKMALPTVVCTSWVGITNGIESIPCNGFKGKVLLRAVQTETLGGESSTRLSKRLKPDAQTFGCSHCYCQSLDSFASFCF